MKCVQSLWIGKKLSRMEIASIRSFLSNGYSYYLYSYNELDNLPTGAELLDANEIINEKNIFVYSGDEKRGGGSYSGFSNYFRYTLLIKKGGIWVDTDVYCLSELPEQEYLFVKEKNYVASCILKCPINSEFANICLKECEKRDKNKIKWGQTGPDLVTKVVNKLGFNIEEEEKYLPIQWDEIYKFIKSETIPNSITIHFWNEMWRRNKLDKNATFSKNCLYEKLISKSTGSKLF